MRTSLTDEAYLWSKFDSLDSDHGNCIDLKQFTELVWSLGLEFGDAYTHKAFSQIERDPFSKISFERFRDWWIVDSHTRTQGTTSISEPTSLFLMGRQRREYCLFLLL
jgi:Ca2+-binding EF-hand superfamily protein